MAKEKPGRTFKLPFNLSFLRKDAKIKPIPPQKTIPRLKMIFFIVDWNKSHFVTDACEEEQVRFYFICRGIGTASSEVLDLLGIGAADKAVILCIEQEILVPVLLKEARKKLGFHSPGAGIAFTIPLSGINTPLLRVFKESINKNDKIALEREGEAMAAEEKTQGIQNDLIIAVINHGYSDDLMTTAREAGASGGTVINGRGIAHQGPVKFFGVSVQDEKEIVLILSSREKKVPIMESVSLAYGLTSKAEGLIFSLPVDYVMGLTLE